jgi:hypothetical protein
MNIIQPHKCEMHITKVMEGSWAEFECFECHYRERLPLYKLKGDYLEMYLLREPLKGR